MNGGYGLFGVILEVDIELTDDVVYKANTQWIDYRDYPKYFRESILVNPEIEMHNARISIAPNHF